MLLPTWGLAIIYLLILLYMFVGVALASDKFMNSIEVRNGSSSGSSSSGGSSTGASAAAGAAAAAATTAAASAGRQRQSFAVPRAWRSAVPRHRGGAATRVPVWNWVVANVSLMAVGSSAPEILLAVARGELGPSTIVGSAAYNLLMIVAVCTVALPTGVVKHVRHLRVFITTGVVSMWAYVWMLVVYLWWTPSEVTVAEALLTLLQFGLLLVIGWAVDVKAIDVTSSQQEASAEALEAGLRSSSRPNATLHPAPALHRSSGNGAAPSSSLQKPPSFNRNSRNSSLTRDGNTLQKTSSLGAAASTAAAAPSAGAAAAGGGGGGAGAAGLGSGLAAAVCGCIEYDSKAAEDGEEPGGAMGLLLHFGSIFWKLCMATAPPEWWGGGWPCFFGSLLWVIAQVVVIDEAASLLGCIVGLSPLVIGMSLVALGTSLPDTFCSRSAALRDSHADAAVGNITGSNAANVFLGLGLPWLISSCYYAARGERFCSDSGALAFSVLVYSCCAVVWMAVLITRRVYAGGELGAHSALGKWGLFAVAFGLWGMFLVLTGLVSHGEVSDSWIAVQAGTCSSPTS
ncbi:Sodium/calcium exchanger protein-domain-containing protein [Scenedesmus sp. NREL 46B-D3]|nr:Sodium/calcium exchanger protein-domain-containing protein [Scenedesmus sp. NREL 46B-D3]